MWQGPGERLGGGSDLSTASSCPLAPGAGSPVGLALGPGWALTHACPCRLPDQHILRELEKKKILVFTPSRRVGGKRVVCYDDRFIVKLAFESDGVVVSNDTYRDLQGERQEWKRFIEERLLMYSFVNDKCVPEGAGGGLMAWGSWGGGGTRGALGRAGAGGVLGAVALDPGSFGSGMGMMPLKKGQAGTRRGKGPFNLGDGAVALVTGCGQWFQESLLGSQR